MKKEIFKGVGTAIVTPFKENDVNYQEFGRLLEDQINAGIETIIVCGTTGEATTMDEVERNKLIHYAINKASGRAKIIVGTGSNNTKQAIKLSKKAEMMGADGLLIVTPYYNKTTQKGIIAHYEAIAKEVDTPIILYNVPSRTGLNIKPETYEKLAKIDNIVAVKEASGDLNQIKQITELCDLDIYSGNDDQIVPILKLGGKGVISVLSNVKPEYTIEMVNSYFNGDIEKADKMQEDAMELINSLFCETNPIPVKYALTKMGYDCALLRLPLIELSDENKPRVEKALKLK